MIFFNRIRSLNVGSIFVIIKLLCFTLFCSQAKAQSTIQNAIYDIVRDEDFRHASLSICVIDLEKDSLIGAYQAYSSLAPASTMKIFTTYAALSVLGKDFRFKTELEYDGEIIDSTLNGNIFIKGYGDPTLGSARFPRVDNIHQISKEFSKAIRGQNIYHIQGSIIGDGSYYNAQSIPDKWQWDDIGNYYGAGSFGLNIHDNEFTVFFAAQRKENERPEIERIFPVLHEMSLINGLICGPKNSGDNCIVFGEPIGKSRFLSGTIPAGNSRFFVRGSIPNPPLTCAQYLFNSYSSNKNTTISGEAMDINNFLKASNTVSVRHSFYTYFSPKLSNIITQTNHRSVNLYAETLLRELGKNKYSIGSCESGLQALYSFWKEKNLEMEGLYFEDGSGLCARNAVSAKHFVDALSIAYKDTLNGQIFYNSLPEAGKEGTVRSLISNYAGKGSVHIKSGSMTRVKSYAGYIESSSGRKYAFAFIANNYSCSSRAVKQKLGKLLVEILSQ